MHSTLPAAVLAGTLLVAPAFAQGSGSTPGSQTQPGHSQGGQAQAGQTQRTQTQGSQAQVTAQQQLRRQLEQAGFRDVQVLDAAYLVQARTQDGNTVVMMINPPGSGMQGAGMSSGRGPSSPNSGAGTSGGPAAASGASPSR